MNLDDVGKMRAIDTQRMIGHIVSLPDQLEAAWHLGLMYPLPPITRPANVVIVGMGGSGLGGDLLAAYLAPICQTPVFILRDYDLPAWVHGPQNLVVAASYSGDTEETLSAFSKAQQRGCQLLAISTGGMLTAKAEEYRAFSWVFEQSGTPRAAVGFSFGLLLALFHRLGLLTRDPTDDLNETAQVMREQQKFYAPDTPVARNPAKRLAGQLVDRWVMIVASGYLAPVARRWKCQINELAKACAYFELLPEADHNTLAGGINPQSLMNRGVVLFLQSASDHPRNRRRSDMTRQVFMLEGISTDQLEAQGHSPLAHIWTSLYMGDYVAYYLAMAYNVDPTPVAAIENLKKAMKH